MASEEQEYNWANYSMPGATGGLGGGSYRADMAIREKRDADAKLQKSQDAVNSGWMQVNAAQTNAYTGQQQGQQNIQNLQSQQQSMQNMDSSGGGYPAMDNTYGLGGSTAAVNAPASDSQKSSGASGASQGFNPWSMVGESNTR